MITTVTLNASVDKAYSMEQPIENGTVMRVASCRNSAGGKGLNVARIVRLCGAQVQTTGFCGGFNGRYLEELLEEDGIAHTFTHVKGETRSCINILDERYGSTEYLEPGCTIEEEEEKEFLAQFARLAEESSVITISGSLPKGVRRDVYGVMVGIAKDAGKKVILDTSGDALKEGLQAAPTMVKPNKDEMKILFGEKISSMEDVIRCGKQIYEMGIPYVVISLGKDGALLVCEDGIFQGRPPQMKALNTVGCGDSMVGAFAVEMEKGTAPAETLKKAVAVASANAMSTRTGNFERKDYEEILKGTTVRRL